MSRGHREIAEASIKAGKESVQNELNQSQSEIIDTQWQSHCQFYADCTDCQRLQAKPATDKAMQQAVVIINTAESCKRIKPENNTHRRIFAEPLTKHNQELLTD